MYLFSADLETQTEAEATAQKNFEQVMAAKAKKLAELKAILAKKEMEKAETEKDLADASEDSATTTTQLKEDTACFDEMKAVCAAKSGEWEERSKMRDEELKGINEALKLLTSDEVRELLGRVVKPGVETSFLQRSASFVVGAPRASLQDAEADRGPA